MIEVFITDIKKKSQAKKILKDLIRVYYELKINFDMNETNLPFPHGHTVLRIEGEIIYSREIILMVTKSGFKCEIMEDIISQ